MDTINGFPIVATWHTQARGCELRGRLIVVDRGTEYDERYVVAWQAEGAKSWDESAYCETLREAHGVFTRRIFHEVHR